MMSECIKCLPKHAWISAKVIVEEYWQRFLFAMLVMLLISICALNICWYAQHRLSDSELLTVGCRSLLLSHGCIFPELNNRHRTWPSLFHSWWVYEHYALHALLIVRTSVCQEIITHKHQGKFPWANCSFSTLVSNTNFCQHIAAGGERCNMKCQFYRSYVKLYVKLGHRGLKCWDTRLI